MSVSDKVDLIALARRYLVAQLAGNRREALRLVIDEGLHQGASITELQSDVVRQAQREIGRMWQENQISVAQEHMATAISQVVLSRLFEQAEREQAQDKKILIACVEGELHEFPARLVSDFLELAGFEVRFLGANVPVDSLVSMVKQERPDLLALSVTMSFNVPALRSTVERVRRELGLELPIVVGGHALSWDEGLARECDVETCDTNPASLVAMAKRLLGSHG